MSNLPVGSYSFINTYQLCPRKARHYYVLKDVPYEETPETRKGNTIHLALELRLKNGTVLPPLMAQYEQFAMAFEKSPIIQPEWKAGVTAEGTPCEFFGERVYIRGKLDVPIVQGSIALLGDWKTGKVREDPFELEVQAVLLQAHYPHVRKISGFYVWLNELRLGVTHDLSDTHRTWKTITKIMGDAKQSLDTDQWPAVKNPLCGWCSVLSCENNPKRAP